MQFQVYVRMNGTWFMYCEYATEGAAQMCVHRLKDAYLHREAYYIDRYQQRKDDVHAS